MAKAVKITPEGKVSVVDYDHYSQVVEMVGGDLEVVPFGEKADAYVNEDGIALGLPYNSLATRLIKNFLRRLGRDLLPGEFIKGTMLVVGLPDEEGEETSCPEEVTKEILSYVPTEDGGTFAQPVE